MNDCNKEESKKIAITKLYDLFTQHDEEGVWEDDIKMLIDHLIDAVANELSNRLINKK